MRKMFKNPIQGTYRSQLDGIKFQTEIELLCFLGLTHEQIEEYAEQGTIRITLTVEMVPKKR